MQYIKKETLFYLAKIGWVQEHFILYQPQNKQANALPFGLKMSLLILKSV